MHEGLRVDGDLRRARHRGQGRHDQADHGAAQRAVLPRRRARHADGARAHAVVLPALHRAPSRGRRDRAVRPQLVQPRRRRARHGLLHRGGARRVLPHLPAARARARALRHHPRQVLAVVERRRAGAALHRADQQPGQAMEAQPDGPRGARPVGRLRRGEGRDVRVHRHQRGAVARRRRRRQEGGAPQHHQPPPPGRAVRRRSRTRRSSSRRVSSGRTSARRSTARPGSRRATSCSDRDHRVTSDRSRGRSPSPRRTRRRRRAARGRRPRRR